MLHKESFPNAHVSLTNFVLHPKRFYHPSGGRNRHDDTDEEDDSDEIPSFRGRRGNPGGFSEGDVNDPKVKEIANFAVKSMDSLSEDPRVRVVEKIDSVQKQVSAVVVKDFSFFCFSFYNIKVYYALLTW